MKATVVYDENGEIIAISKAVDLREAGSKFTEVGIIPRKGQYALEVELTGELVHMPLPDVHQQYRLDRVTSKLVKRPYTVAQ
jgi:hypothetical protein